MSDNYKELPLIEIFVDPPASASAPGVTGQVAFDTSYFYICINTDTWKRIGIATWP